MKEIKVPFLMYHAVQEGGGADPVYTVALDQFEQQLATLRRSGFQTITLAEYLAWHRYRTPLPSKPIVLTFDDGHPSHLEVVLPRLSQYHFRGVFGVVPSWVGTPQSVSLEGIRALQAAGMEVISHGMTHVPLTELDIPAIRKELKDSRVQLESWLGKPVKHVAIPRGYCSLRVRQVAYEVGYQTVLTSQPGYNGLAVDLYSLARLPVKAHHQLSDFVAMVEGHAARRLLDLGGYLARRGAQRVLGVKVYDKVRRHLLRMPAEGVSSDA